MPSPSLSDRYDLDEPMERDVSGWQFEVVTKKLDGPDAGLRVVEIYAVHVPAKVAAWAAVAKEADRTKPLSPLTALGRVPEAVLLAEGILPGQVKLMDRIL